MPPRQSDGNISPISVRLSPQQRLALDVLAGLRATSIADLVRQSVDFWINEQVRRLKELR
jgi:hypothetical protein